MGRSKRNKYLKGKDIAMNDRLYDKSEVEDELGRDIDDRDITSNDLPDPSEVADWIIKILNRMLDPEMLQLRDEDKIKFTRKLDNEFREFSDRYYGLFDMTINMEDPDMLITFIEQLHKVKMGQLSFDDATAGFIDDLDEKHLYPSFSKKDVDAMKKQKIEEYKKRKGLN